MKDRAARESELGARYRKLKSSLTERGRRLFVANEAIAFGYGGIIAAARATGMAPSVIGRGIAEVRAIEAGSAPSLPPTRSRRPGGGRKKATEKDPTLVPDLKSLVEATTRGDPESPLLWTARSQRNLVAALDQLGHRKHPAFDVVDEGPRSLGSLRSADYCEVHELTLLLEIEPWRARTIGLHPVAECGRDRHVSELLAMLDQPGIDLRRGIGALAHARDPILEKAVEEVEGVLDAQSGAQDDSGPSD